MRPALFSLLVVPLLACAAGEARTSDSSAAARSDSQATKSGVGRDTTNHFLTDTAIIRGLYVNRFAAQSMRRMRKLIAMADSTEINAFVIDMKDEFGLNYKSDEARIALNAGRMGAVPNLKALLDTLEAHDILPIARLVVFKDSVAARANPVRTIRKADGGVWRDREGLTWVNPYDREIWEYNIRVAEEMVRLGFPEIQFDYIRFPEPYRSLPKQVFPGANGESKPDALATYLKTACGRIRKLGGRCTADVFGLITTVKGALEIGQDWDKLSPVTDVLLPMVYPSHYPRGAFGVDRPNAEPYKIIFAAIAKAHERDRNLGIKNPEHVRAWLQAFSIGQPKYGAAQIEAQKKAVYDAGYDGWVLWHPGSLYEPFVGGLEKTTVSRKQVQGTRNKEPGSR